jgi:hypothetical protein
MPKNVPNHEDARSLEAFRDLTYSVDCLTNYNFTRDENQLELAKMYSKQSMTADIYYKKAIFLLFNIGIVYLNKKNYYEAERLARR